MPKIFMVHLHTYKAIEKQNPPTIKNSWLWVPGLTVSGHSEKANNLGNIYWGLDANEKFHELEVRFFDYYLKGKEMQEIPEATIFVTGQKWRNFDTWPPKNVTEKNLYFQPEETVIFKSFRNSKF